MMGAATVFICTFMCAVCLPVGAAVSNDDYRFVMWTDETLDGNTTMSNTLIVQGENLTVYCWLTDPTNDTLATRQALFDTYIALNQAPSLTIYNRTWSQTFHFPSTNESKSWELTIPTTEFSHQDKTPTEQWRVSLALGHRNFLTQGSLLLVQREPILHWLLGDRLPAPPVLWEKETDQLVITKSPCSPDVAVLGVAENNFTSAGVILGVTYHHFRENYTTWFNMTQNPSLCNITTDCSLLRLVDFLLTNRHLLLLTNQGLYVSSDLIGWDSLAQVQFLSTSINSLMSAVFQAGNVSRANTRLWNTPECESVTPGYTPADHVIITHHPPVGSEINNTSYYSTAPYTTWETLAPNSGAAVVSAAYDIQKDNFVILKQTQDGPRVTVVSRTGGGGQLYPPAEFPPSFTPSGLAFHPVNHFLYAYGSQVFVSLDGGSSFDPILSLPVGQSVSSFDADVHHGTVAMVTGEGDIFYGTADDHAQ
ncbi:cation channel sperm-associated protein subunit beta-like [Branchiostoma floridae]|uniref:Cation channel sperm-associated protein subunit beta-like n=1 Tax=Branchiostoma floridae TaxID=7739 RepID=A0A9J7LMA5_BRAFL|nr:cation channel sperm-associated protein subunit beta-like [Branchiostoma floridae]